MTTHTIDELIPATFQSHGETNTYYALILSKCKRYKSEEIQTMGVCFDKQGGLVLLYNPDYLKRLTDAEALAVLKHEALHIFLLHLTRFQTRKNQERVNIACDMAINQHLKSLPIGAQYPETYDLPKGLSADAYIKALEEKGIADKNKLQMPGSGSKKGKGQGGGGNKQQQQGQGDQQQDNNGDGGGGGDQNQNNQDDHSLWNQCVDENGKLCGSTEENGVDGDSTVERIAKMVAQQMKEKGNAPAWAEAAIEALDKKPKHNWQNELRVLVNSVLSVYKKRSQKRIDRKMACITQEFFLPGKKKDRQPSVLVVRDTSGSMFCEELQKEILAEMIAISKRAEVQVADCDVEIHQVYKVKKITDFKAYKGGGGTSFVKPFELAKKLGVDAVIYMTDLYGDFPDPKAIGRYSRDTIWVTVERDTPTSVPFGKLVRIADER